MPCRVMFSQVWGHLGVQMSHDAMHHLVPILEVGW